MVNRPICCHTRLDYVKRVTPTGIVVLLSATLIFVVLYLLSYPLAEISRNSIFSLPLGSTVSIFYTVLGLTGLALIVKYRKNLTLYELALAVLMAAFVCVAIEMKHWSDNWVSFYPYPELVFYGTVIMLMTLGALAMLKSERVIHVRAADEKYEMMFKSIVLGWIIGLPFAILNILFFLLIVKQQYAAQDILTNLILAAWPSLMEGIGVRLLLMSLALVMLSKYVPKKIAIAASLLVGAFIVPAISASGQLITEPLAALAGVIMTGLLFGLPIAWLAYRHDIESSIGGQWIILVVQYSLGY